MVHADVSSITAFILTGGLGTRLRPVTGDLPKVLAPVAGRPFLEYLLCYLRNQGVSDIVLCTGYGAEEIRNYFMDGSPYGITIRYSREEHTMGTGGAIKYAEPLIVGERLLVLNGDSLVRFDLNRLLGMHLRKDARASMVLVRVPDKKRFGSVSVSADGQVTAFNEKSGNGSGLINAGIYLLERDVLSFIPPNQKISIEYDVFPNLIGRRLYGQVADGPFIDIGTPESYRDAQAVLPARSNDLIQSK